MICAALVCTLAAAAGPLPQGSPAAETDHGNADFASALRRVVRAGREQFLPLKSFRVDIRPGRRSWYEVKLSLPGASECRIDEYPELVYRCAWSGKPGVYADLVKRVEAALGDDWTRSSRAKTTRFEPRNPRWGRVEVRQGESVELVAHAPAQFE